MILALGAGTQMRIMPMAMASPGAGVAGMASDMGSGPCKGCIPGKMTVIDCGALCATIVAVVDVTPSPLRHAAPMAWLWSNEPTRSRSCEPDTTPPRS